MVDRLLLLIEEGAAGVALSGLKEPSIIFITTWGGARCASLPQAIHCDPFGVKTDMRVAFDSTLNAPVYKQSTPFAL